MTRSRLLLCLVSAALLAACTEEPADDDARAASGEVLEGTVSDAMLPLDTVRSQPPLAEPAAAAGAGARVDPAAEDEVETAGDDEGQAAEEEAEGAAANEAAGPEAGEEG